MSPILTRLSSAGGGGTGGFSFGKKVLALIESAPPQPIQGDPNDPLPVPTDFLVYEMNPPSGTTVTLHSRGDSFISPPQSYDVDWGDGTIESFTDTEQISRSHTYSTSGPYTVTITSTSGFYWPSFAYWPGRRDVRTVNGLGGSALGYNDTFTGLESSWKTCLNMTQFGSYVNMSHIQTFYEAWMDCTSLSYFGPTNFSSATNFYGAWRNCSSLTSFPSVSAPNVTNVSNAWRGCTSLTSFPAISFSRVTNFSLAWYDCSSLTTFPANMFDTTGTLGSGSFSGAWQNCALTAQSIENILVSLDTNGASNITLGIDGGTNAAYSTWSSAAQTALSNLQGKSWTIAYNS